MTAAPVSAVAADGLQRVKLNDPAATDETVTEDAKQFAIGAASAESAFQRYAKQSAGSD